MTFEEFAARLKVDSRSGNQIYAKCPAHKDSHASLSVSTGKEGKIILNCHAGCTPEQIMTALGLKMSDLYPDSGQDHARRHTGKYTSRAQRTAEAHYTYTDESGAFFCEKTRWRFSDGSKSFTWRHKDAAGNWVNGRGGMPYVLYNLPAVRDADRVYIVEGEKDVETMKRMGFVAVSSPDGASSKWREEYTKPLIGKYVSIIPDNDDTGRAFAASVAHHLHGKAASVKLLDLTAEWPKLKEKGDITDVLKELEGDKLEDVAARLTALDGTTPEYVPGETPLPSNGRTVKAAASFGEDKTCFLWYPYLPIGDYTVMMADGGTGKTILCCGIAADVSTGKALPGDAFNGKGKNVLIISAEDSGEVLKKRLKLSGADLNRVFILDRSDSIGLNFSEDYEEFEATIKSCDPALIIIDPWHGYLGERVDINKVNALRPIFQKLSNAAKECQCALILVSHVNKRAQGENANNAATGSTDFINAARSAVRVIFDEEDPDCRIMVHTKTNYAGYGKSVKYRIIDGGLEWAGFSEITKQTLETAARRKSTPWEITERTNEREAANAALIDAVKKSSREDKPARYSYDEFKVIHGEWIFNGQQPKRALDAIKGRLTDDGYFVKTCIVKKDGKTRNGFMIQKIERENENENSGQFDLF